MKVKRVPMIQDGLDVNDYRGNISEELDLPPAEAKHLIDTGRAEIIRPKKKSKAKA